MRVHVHVHVHMHVHVHVAGQTCLEGERLLEVLVLGHDGDHVAIGRDRVHLAHEVLQVAVSHLDQVTHGEHLPRALGGRGGGEQLVVGGAAEPHLEALELGQRGRDLVRVRVRVRLGLGARG